MTRHDRDDARTTGTHQPTRETRDREVIVTDRSGTSAGTVIAAVIGVLLVLLVGWLLFGGGFGDADDAPAVDVPSEVEVDVDGGGGEG